MYETSTHARFATALHTLPLIAILRGIEPTDAEAVATALYAAAFRLIEVSLTSPAAFDSIARVRRALPADALVGAGTVLRTDDVGRLRDVGGELIVMPHADGADIRAAQAAGLVCVPGVTTPTEAFAALNAGATALKLFPAELITPPVVKALRAVLPAALPLFPVGGIAPEAMAGYVHAGANGFGLGSALYAPGASADQVGQRARRFADEWRAITTSRRDRSGPT
jgi:2-dehydro-3-deoxyphosphogalactonate aldolase